MKKRLKKLSLWAIPTSLLALILSFFTNTQIATILMCIALIIEADIIFKKKLRKEMVIALLFALIITSYYNYEYEGYNLKLGKINLYPLVCWTAGLILFREIYSGSKIKHKKLLIIVLYIAVLLGLEYLFYHFLNVRLKANYPGLLGFDVLHAPTELKVFYLSAGPLYLLITDYLGIKK